MALLIDQEDGLKRVMNNKGLYTKLLGKFRAETNIEPIFAALDKGAWEDARNLAHTIKGVTANLSIKDLNEKVVDLETQIKAREVKPETAEAVKTSFAETLAEIDKVLADG
ncbi:MAG: Hpt domain-containing protein [Treponema sp.]|jgi:HPt (histidine-containing phosphotransfer) domain-containing protein|nr:Hpt domain-containing protein [Treponema sp.]